MGVRGPLGPESQRQRQICCHCVLGAGGMAVQPLATFVCWACRLLRCRWVDMDGTDQRANERTIEWTMEALVQLMRVSNGDRLVHTPHAPAPN